MTGWVRSRQCAAGDCVYVSAHDGRIYLGQGLERQGAPHTFMGILTPAEWDAFIAGVKAGDFDQLDAP